MSLGHRELMPARRADRRVSGDFLTRTWLRHADRAHIVVACALPAVCENCLIRIMPVA